ncbi:hypothetical protein Clacol_009655 [Clathrus columnatus]|uniref:Cytochrome P450 n=1 Tax=Clathrus columnatus TaxID=1419009 RepID=A0AAV5AQE1_9AGAM|nr:hypothetical protein Clacol_009655 [Clathrus columnatus]
MTALIDYVANNTLFVISIATGVLTWFFLNRKPIRGDYAVTLYLLAFSLSYILNRTFFPSIISISKYWGIHIFSALLTTILYRISPFHPLNAFPGPFWWRITNLKLAYVSSQGKRHLIFHDLHQKYGPYVRIGPDVLSINSAQGLQVIYGNTHHMEKSDAYITPGHLDAVALFFKQETKNIHSRRKRIWSAAFTGSNVLQFVTPLNNRTWQLVQCIENRKDRNNVVDLSTCLAHWSYDFMGEMVFGGATNLELMRDGDPNGLLDGLKTAATALDSFGQVPWLMDIIWHLPFGSSMHQIQHRAAAMMRKRQGAGWKVDMSDLASYLLSGDPSTGQHLPQGDLDLDAVVAIQGGSDNTAIILSLAFFYLLSRRVTTTSGNQTRYYDQLYTELRSAIPDAKYLDINMNILTELPILNGVINETLRLGSPFFLPRVVPSGGADIAGRFVPGGTIVASAAYSQQIDAENFWPEPMEFRPERWCTGELGSEYKTNRSALASFSLGPHACVAKSFAYQELRFVIARLVLALDMWLPSSESNLFDPKAFEDGVVNMRTTMLLRPLLVCAEMRKSEGDEN